MAASSKAYKYFVEFNVHAVDAPGTRLTGKGDLYVNICLLGTHKRTRLMPPYLPMHIDQKLFFDKVFKFCADPQDIIQRLEREHVLIELIQNDVPAPLVLASYETSAKDFLYPYSYERVQHTGLRRYVLLSRTIDFPGISPSFEFSTNASVEDVTGLELSNKTRKSPKPFDSYGKSPKRSKSPTRNPSSSLIYRSKPNVSASMSRSLTTPTISSAVKNDFGQRDIQEKLRELAIPGEVKTIVPLDKTNGRRPFVVRHVDSSLIGRQPDSHRVLGDGLVINDYSQSRPESSMSSFAVNGTGYRSRSVSPAVGRTTRARGRSLSPARRSLKISQSADFERRARSRSRTPQPRSGFGSTSSIGFRTDHNYDNGELHPVKDCAICQLHRTHIEQNQRAKSREQQQFSTSSERKSYKSDDYYSGPPRRSMSPTLLRDSFRHRYRQSPATDLSDKVINTLRRNLTSYSAQPWHHYYSAYRYSDGHIDDDDLLARSRRLTQA